MNQCPYCNVNIAEGYVGEVELESHLKEIHEVSFQTMHDAEKWWDGKYVPLGRPSWADMNIGQRRKTINAYLMRSPSTEMRGFLKCPKCGITFNDSEHTDDDLTIHLIKDHQIPEDLAEEMTTFEVGKNGLQPTDGWAAFESDPNPSKMFLDQLQNAGRDGNPNMYWNEEERQYTNDPLRDVSFDPKAGAPWQKNADLESLAKEDDPDYLNDPDYQGYTQDMFGNQVKSHPSQYTLSGWDYEEKERMNARGDVDFAFDSKANEMSVNTWWEQVTSQTGSDLSRFQGTDFNQLPPQEQNHYFNIYMEELGADKYGDNMALFPDSFESKASESLTLCPKCGSYAILQSERGSEWNKCDNCGEEFIEGAKPLQGQPTSSTNDYSVPVERDHAFGWDNVFPAHNNESLANEDSLVKIEDDGKKITTLDEWEGESIANERSPCEDCGGVGKIQGDVCEDCNGTGWEGEPTSSDYYNESYSNEGPFNFTDTEWESFPKETQNQITDELTIKDLQEDSNMTDEGFVDKIDMLANKMGINLDRDPDQYSSEAGSDGDLDWITVNGSHIPINAGQDKGDAIGDFFDKKSNSSKTKKEEPKKDDPVWSGFKPDEPKINSSGKDYDRDIKIYKEKMTKYKKDLNLKQKMDKQIKDSDNRIIKILDYGKIGSRDHEKLTDNFNNNRSKGEKKMTNSQMNNVIEKLKKLDIIKMGTYKKSNPWGFSTEERYELSKGYNILRQGVTEPEKPVR